MKLLSLPQWLNLPSIFGGLVLCLAAAAALSSPLVLWIIIPLSVYAWLLWKHPDYWLVWILALLPWLDFTASSGRLFWTEYDTVLLITVGVGYTRLLPDVNGIPALRDPAKILLLLFVISMAASLAINIYPFETIDANTWNRYTSSYNGLRFVKGLLFALAFIPLLMNEWKDSKAASLKLTQGMVLGLAGVVLYVLWERITFPGFSDFDDDYRIAGPFPSMNVGGASVETYLAVSLPFVVYWLWQQQRIWVFAVATGLFGFGIYCMMVTYSRTGQIAFLLATVIMLTGLVRLYWQKGTPRWMIYGALFMFVGASITTAWPVLTGQHNPLRWAKAEQDLAQRVDHWIDVLDIFKLQKTNIYFGAGPGAFPAAYLWGSEFILRPATYRFQSEQDNDFLQLGSGDPVYFEQVTTVKPGRIYTFAIKVRSKSAHSVLTALICEKSALYPYNCVRIPIKINVAGKEWQHYQAHIETAHFSPPDVLFQRPIKLTLFNNHAFTVVEVDDISLVNSTGDDAISNGDFSTGMAHWFFSAHNFAAWHVDNWFLGIIFEQGGVGLVCFILLIGYVLTRNLSQAKQGIMLSWMLCASLAAFLCMGVFHSWNDEPRLGFLFYLLLMIGLVSDKHPNVPTPAPDTIKTPARNQQGLTTDTSGACLIGFDPLNKSW